MYQAGRPFYVATYIYLLRLSLRVQSTEYTFMPVWSHFPSFSVRWSLLKIRFCVSQVNQKGQSLEATAFDPLCVAYRSEILLV